MTYDPTLSRATAEAINLMVSLAQADRHPADRDAHLKAALRSFLALAPMVDGLGKALEPPVSNVIPLRVEPVSAFEAWRA